MPPTSSRQAFASEAPHADYVGMRLLSGTGERLGVVVGIENDRYGTPKHLVFIEEGSGIRRHVPLRVVRAVSGGDIRLAGPRQGYHITRLL